MELTNVEIDVLVDYHTNMIELCKRRFEGIRDDEANNRYDTDLIDMQVTRIKKHIDMCQSRIEELEKLKKEL